MGLGVCTEARIQIQRQLVMMEQAEKDASDLNSLSSHSSSQPVMPCFLFEARQSVAHRWW